MPSKSPPSPTRRRRPPRGRARRGRRRRRRCTAAAGWPRSHAAARRSTAGVIRRACDASPPRATARAIHCRHCSLRKPGTNVTMTTPSAVRVRGSARRRGRCAGGRTAPGPRSARRTPARVEVSRAACMVDGATCDRSTSMPSRLHLAYHVVAERRRARRPPARRWRCPPRACWPRASASGTARRARSSMPQHAQRVVDAVAALDTEQRRRCGRRPGPLDLVGGGGQGEADPGTARPAGARSRSARARWPARRPASVQPAGHVDRPELRADAARAQPGQVGVQAGIAQVRAQVGPVEVLPARLRSSQGRSLCPSITGWRWSAGNRNRAVSGCPSVRCGRTLRNRYQRTADRRRSANHPIGSCPSGGRHWESAGNNRKDIDDYGGPTTATIESGHGHRHRRETAWSRRRAKRRPAAQARTTTKAKMSVDRRPSKRRPSGATRADRLTFHAARRQRPSQRPAATAA